MSYSPQRQDEQSYIADLNKHDQAIWDYHQQHKVPLEDAYQAVTGKPWMAGRSIKFVGGTKGNTGNGFDMTKDRTFKSVLGKYVAPIGAGVLTALTAGGAAPALAGLFGGGGGAAAGGAGAGVAGASGAAGTLGGAGFGLGAAGTAGATGAAGTLGAAGGSSLLGTLGTLGKSGLGDMLTQGAGANAAGRREDAAANMQAAPFNLNAPNVRAQQVARGDVLQNLQPYTGSGSGKDFHISGGLSPALFGPDTRQAGEALKKQALTALLTKSDQIQPNKAGLGENVMAGTGLGINLLGQLGNIGKLKRFF